MIKRVTIVYHWHEKDLQLLKNYEYKLSHAYQNQKTVKAIVYTCHHHITTA